MGQGLRRVPHEVPRWPNTTDGKWTIFAGIMIVVIAESVVTLIGGIVWLNTKRTVWA